MQSGSVSLMKSSDDMPVIRCLLSAVICTCLLFTHKAAYPAMMTLFNDTGEWELGVLGEVNNPAHVLRVCKNSRDRSIYKDSTESMAIMCITINKFAGEQSLGIWSAERLASPGHAAECKILSGDDCRVLQCQVMNTNIGKSHIELLKNKYDIKKLLDNRQLKLKIYKSSPDTPPMELEFDIEAARLKEVAPEVWRYLEQ